MGDIIRRCCELVQVGRRLRGQALIRTGLLPGWIRDYYWGLYPRNHLLPARAVNMGEAQVQTKILVSGQWPVSCAAAWPNEGFICCGKYTTVVGVRQDEVV